MNVKKLNPCLTFKFLEIDCPKCKDTKKPHRLKIKIGNGGWTLQLNWTLTPSYRSLLPCKAHFNITNEVVEMHE